MTKSDRGTPLTISLQIPTYWTPEQAFAVFELVDELRETIWRCYALQLQQEYRDQRRHHDADYDPIEPTICRSDLQSPSKTQRGLSAPFVAIAPPLRGFTQPLTVEVLLKDVNSEEGLEGVRIGQLDLCLLHPPRTADPALNIETIWLEP